MHVGGTIEVSGVELDRSGSCSARLGDRWAPLDVQVLGLLPDELATAELTHIGKSRGQRPRRAYARLLEIIEPSPHRQHAVCAQHPSRAANAAACGGCPLMIVRPAEQTSIKASQLRALGLHVDRVVRDDRELGYRWSSKRVLAMCDDTLVVGSYRPGSHDLAAMPACAVDHPDLSACFDELAEVAATHPDTATHAKALRFAWAKTNDEGQVLATLVLAPAPSAAQRAYAQQLLRRLTSASGAAMAIKATDDNAMRGHHIEHVQGMTHLSVTLCGATIRVGPLGFLQPNPPVAAMAYGDLVGEESGALAFDLYAGAGVTTHLLRQHFEEVRACEAWPESAAELGVPAQTAEAFLSAQPDTPNLIVANPPRSGMGAAVCAALNDLGRRAAASLPLRIMSCEPRSLARDIAQLTGEGPYTLDSCRAYDTLPHTTHIEVVASLRVVPSART